MSLKVYDLQVALEGASRTLRLHAEHTLEDLHRAIDRIFLRDEDPVYAFGVGGRNYHPPELVREFGGEPAGASIGSLHLVLGATFEYISGDDPWEPENGDPTRYRIQVVGVGGIEAKFAEPRSIEAKGEIPYRPPADWGGAEQEEEKA